VEIVKCTPRARGDCGCQQDAAKDEQMNRMRARSRWQEVAGDVSG
jgi:hypothetical protein